MERYTLFPNVFVWQRGKFFMDDKLTLKNGAAFMEKCLETVLNEQRSAAHSAIDMDDWTKAQEILAVVKRNISLVEDLKARFAEYKVSVDAAEDTILSGGIDVPAKDGGAANAEETPAAEEAPVPQAGAELVRLLEDLIVKFPAPMMVCNEAAEIGSKFTYDSAASASMKSPSQLSNGLFVDTAISMDEAQSFVRTVREYCKNHNN